MVIAFCIGVMLSFIQIFIDYRAEHRLLSSTVDQLLQSVTKPAEESIWLLNDQLAIGVVEGLFAYHPILEARIETSEGLILAQRQRQVQQSDWHQLAVWLFGTVHERSIALRSLDPDSDMVIGRVLVVVDPEAVANAFFKRSGLVLIGGILRTSLLSFILFIVFFLSLTKPILALTDFVTSFNPLRPDVSMPELDRARTGGEMRALYDSTQDLVASVQQHLKKRLQAEEALLVMNAQLEERVEERTRELESAIAELETQAITDALTGAHNRRHFLQRAEEAFEHWRRTKTVMAIVYLDADRFKSINDDHGHAIGDMVLITLSKLARKHLRKTDVFARLGGEEFAFILPGTDMEGALAFAERYRRDIAETPINTGTQTIRVTVSIGVAVTSAQTPTLESLLKAADAASYQAKETGRNRVCAA